MNIGLIGSGYWGKNLLRNLLVNQRIKNIFVLDFNLANIKKSPNVNYYHNKKDFFSIKNIDGYLIATPTESHFEYINECLNLNKFVCITKPFTSNYKQVLKIENNFKNTEKIFLDHTYLFHSSVKYLKLLINRKKLGKLIYYDSERINFGKFYNDVDVIDDLAVHDLYILDYLLKGQIPNKVRVNSHNIFHDKNFISNISLNYPSGFFANIKVSWYSPIKSRRILLAGNKKIVEFDDNSNDQKIKIYNKGIEFKPTKKINRWLYRTGEIEIPNILHQESLTVMIDNFLKRIISNKKDKKFFNHGKRVIQLLNEIKRKI